MSSPANFAEGLFPEDESAKPAPSHHTSPVPQNNPASESYIPSEPPARSTPPIQNSEGDWKSEPVPEVESGVTGSGSDLFGDVVPIDDSAEAKASALRTHRRESVESRGVEPVDDHIHGAEIPVRELEDRDNRRRRGGRRGGRDEGPRRESRSGGGRFERDRRRPGDSGLGLPSGPPSEEFGVGQQHRERPPRRGGRGNFEVTPAESLIESSPSPNYGEMPPSYSAPLSFSPPPLSFSPPPQAPSYGTTSYGAPPTGDVGGLRREIDELRAQLQRSLTPGSAPSSLYGESAPRSQPMQVSAPMASVPNSTGSMSLFAAQRVAIIADVPSLQRTAKKQFGRVVSFTKLMSSVLRGRGAVRAMAFLAERDASDPSFMSHLRSAGFEIRRSDVGVEMLRRPDAAASLPLEASRLANRVDCIVLAGSDPELLALIPALRSQGCRVELASFPDVGPESMRESTDSYLALGREELI